MERLGRLIKNLVHESPGDHSLYLKDLRSEEVFFYGADKVLPAASLIKVPILYTLLESSSKEEIDLNERIAPCEEDLVGGAGILLWFQSRPALSLLDLAEIMITISDNTATNLLIKRLGFDTINHHLEEMGLEKTRLHRMMMDREAQREGRENTTTAREMGALFEGLYQRPDPIMDKAREILCRQQFRDNLSYLLPGESWSRVASKTGVLKGIEHDATLFLEPSPLVAVAMATELPNQADGKLLQARIGGLIYQYLERRTEERGERRVIEEEKT